MEILQSLLIGEFGAYRARGSCRESRGSHPRGAWLMFPFSFVAFRFPLQTSRFVRPDPSALLVAHRMMMPAVGRLCSNWRDRLLWSALFVVIVITFITFLPVAVGHATARVRHKQDIADRLFKSSLPQSLPSHQRSSLLLDGRPRVVRKTQVRFPNGTRPL